MASLPYVTAPGNVEKALNGIKSAATPERVTQDFVKTILQIPGGSGDQITSFLRKIGLVNSDGTPSDIYRRFRNPTTTGSAAAAALKFGYAPLYRRNEYMHKLSESDLKGLIIEETGMSEDSNVVSLIMSAIRSIKKFSSFDKEKGIQVEVEAEEQERQEPGEREIEKAKHISHEPREKLGMNLSYTINLNLPATSDIAVFNAIFKSLKENLLNESER